MVSKNKSEIEKRCPFCQQENKCAVNSEQRCWCMLSSIPKDLLRLIPEQDRGKRCVCAKCVQSFNKDPEQFKKELRDLVSE